MTSLDQNNFYVTVKSNASRDIYDLNTHADFAVKLAQPIDLGTTSKWEVGFAKFRVLRLPKEQAPSYCTVT